jgi:ISXO2-like transposase domain
VKPGVRAQDRIAGTSNKTPVFSLLQRDGEVRSHVVRRVTAANLKPIVEQMVAADARIMTDSGTALRGALMGRKHDQVNHRADEYVRYENGVTITTNRVEGFFSILKRGINGVYHHVGSQHLHRYLSEFDFRYNSRKITDGERAGLALKGFNGKRLMYKQTRPN